MACSFNLAIIIIDLHVFTFVGDLFIMFIIFFSTFQKPNQIVAIKAITKKNLAKSQNLLGKEIKILKVR